MKRILGLIALISITLSLSATPISRSRAKALAKQALQVADLEFVEMEPQVKARVPGAAQVSAPAYYAFNSDADRGFVIISGDDQFPAVVGYSKSGSISVDSEMPEQLAAFLNDYTEYVEAVRKGEAAAPQRAKGDITGDVVVAPLLTCKWGQDMPYNYYCPNNYPVGCVATAMSQILYYHKYPAQAKGTISYSYGEGALTVDLNESTYDWSLFKDSFSTLEYKRAGGKAVAKLCYDCGVSVYMGYAAGGSGATTVEAYNALFNNFRYNAQTIQYLMRECAESQEEWNRILFNELNNRRPVLYAASSPSGGGSDSGGHAFVIDGYDSNNFVHVNWGWDGNADGYYDIPLLDPMRYQFTNGQEMIIGITPDPEGKFTERNQFPMYMESPLTTTTVQIPQTKEFIMNPGGIFNRSPYSAAYFIGVALYDLNGNQLKVISDKRDAHLISLQPYYGYRDKVPTVTCSMADVKEEGTYILRFVTQESGFEGYVLPRTVGGHGNNAVFVKLAGGRLYFNEVPTGIKDVEAGLQTTSTEYFDLNGRRLNSLLDASGIVVERTNHSDGTTTTRKILVR